MLRSGAIWKAVRSRTERALRCGALQPIATQQEVFQDRGMSFVVHILAHLERKRTALTSQQSSGINPFLPYDPNLFVTHISDTHLCLLNKFNVLEHHLLIVTRDFEDQMSLLNERDFEALALCLDEVDGLGFYNAGTVAGASQPHKHLQLVPVPLVPGPEPTPIEPKIQTAAREGSPGIVTGLPFCHGYQTIDWSSFVSSARAATALCAAYKELLTAVGIRSSEQPYNLLISRNWMLLVPRKQECFAGISVNSLGFAGSLLVKDRSQLALVKRHGPMEILVTAAGAGPGKACPSE
jgi:ATP adenylyltransferase